MRKKEQTREKREKKSKKERKREKNRVKYQSSICIQFSKRKTIYWQKCSKSQKVGVDL